MINTKSYIFVFLLGLVVPLMAQTPSNPATIDVTFAWCFPNNSVTYDTVCAEDPVAYYWHTIRCDRTTPTEPNTPRQYDYMLKNARGCDSTATLMLTVEQCVPQGALNNYRFSVSPTKKVYFSQGNLQYQASTSTWRFAEHQHECYSNGGANPYPGQNSSNWQDLFPWGTSGYNNKFPYLKSSYDASYASKADIAGTDYDWGQYNAISNGGNQAGIWRTLTAAEWKYLLTEREDAVAKCGMATIKYLEGSTSISVRGFIILPDEFVYPEGILPVKNPERYSNVSYYNNSYNEAEWASMEANGVLFLPAGGYYMQQQNGSYVTINVKTQDSNLYPFGRYWSSTYLTYDSAFGWIDAGAFVFQANNNPNPSGGGQFSNGYSVRLVHDCKR